MGLEIETEDDQKVTPHLAMTHKALQGGSANGRNISLLMKSAEMSEAIEKALEGLGLEGSVVKSAFYGQIRNVLQSALTDQFGGDDWDDWCYVEDFDDSTVVFCTDDGLFITSYKISDNGTVATLGETATPVTASVTYTETNGDIMLSDDAEDKLEEGVYTLVKSCTTNPSTVEHLKKMFERKQSEVIKMQEEITKAVDAAIAPLQKALDEQTVVLKAAQDKLAEYEAASVAAVEKARKEQLAAVRPADEVEELFKSLAPLSDEAFAVVVKGFAKEKAVSDQSDLMTETGVNGVGEQDQEKIDGVAAILKARYPQKTQGVK